MTSLINNSRRIESGKKPLSVIANALIYKQLKTDINVHNACTGLKGISMKNSMLELTRCQNGVVGVGGSNPLAPTIFLTLQTFLILQASS